MSDLTIINQNGKHLVDSREVAEMIGKRHDHLLRDIKGYIEVLGKVTAPNFGVSEFFTENAYLDSTGRTLPSYLLTKQGCEMVANKMTGEKGVLFTAKYVQAFNKMAQALRPKQDVVKLLHQQIGLMLEDQEETKSKINLIEEKLDNQITLTFNQAKDVQFAVKERVIGLLGGKGSSDYKEYKNKYFQAIHRDIKKRLGVPSYRDILKKDYSIAIGFISNWIPEANIKSA